jgi:hypothetical protein
VVLYLATKTWKKHFAYNFPIYVSTGVEVGCGGVEVKFD